MAADCTSNTRKGSWTDQEERYALALAAAYQGGLLLEDPRASLREFLAKRLNCDCMRVSKKKVCHQRGKLVYGQSPPRSMAEKMHASQVLEGLRREFLDSLRPEKTRTKPPAPPVFAPGLLMLGLQRLFPVRLCDGNQVYTLNAFTFIDEPLFSKTRADVFVELRPSVGRVAGCSAQTTGMTHPEAVARVAALMAGTPCHAFVHAPKNPTINLRGWGASMVTCALLRNLQRLLDAGGAPLLARLWVAVRPCGSDENATGAVSPTPLLPPHAYRLLPRLPG